MIFSGRGNAEFVKDESPQTQMVSGFILISPLTHIKEDMTEKQGNVLSLIIWIFAVIVMIAGLVFMICYTEKRDKAFNASHHQEEICGEVGENLVAGGWRKADIVYYDVTWDDSTKTRESAYPAFAPLKGDKTCKIIWVAN